jgi:hypothetical protein
MKIFFFHTIGPTDFHHRFLKHFGNSEVGPISDLSDASNFQRLKDLRSDCIISSVSY